jgi:hypothetical protein
VVPAPERPDREVPGYNQAAPTGLKIEITELKIQISESKGPKGRKGLKRGEGGTELLLAGPGFDFVPADFFVFGLLRAPEAELPVFQIFYSIECA